MYHLIARDREESLTLATVLGRGGIILAAAVMVSALAGGLDGDRPTSPPPAFSATTATPTAEVAALEAELASARSALSVERLKNRRGDAIQGFSAQYTIPADLAASIYDHAITEGISPDLAFRLVKVESTFRPDAKSRAKAVGYTQLRLATARHYEPWITERELRTRDVNLRIGFRFLRDLVRQYGGDEQLALLAYNRGPARVNEYLDNGADPDNGYASKVLQAGQ